MVGVQNTIIAGDGGECRSCSGNPAVASCRAGSTVVVVAVVIFTMADCIVVLVLAVVVLISLGPLARPESSA